MFILQRFRDGCQRLMTGTRSYACLEVGQIYYNGKGWWGYDLVGARSTVYYRTKKEARAALEIFVTWSIQDLSKQLGS